VTSSTPVRGDGHREKEMSTASFDLGEIEARARTLLNAEEDDNECLRRHHLAHRPD